jgi:hypothetical protein
MGVFRPLAVMIAGPSHGASPSPLTWAHEGQPTSPLRES